MRDDGGRHNYNFVHPETDEISCEGDVVDYSVTNWEERWRQRDDAIHLRWLVKNHRESFWSCVETGIAEVCDRAERYKNALDEHRS